MTRPKLTVEERKIVGKKVKKLRKEGVLPANIYGKDRKSLAIQVNLKDFEKLYKDVGETGLIDLLLHDKTHPVLIKNLQVAYPSRVPLHADLYEVDLKEKVKTMVPIEIIGEAKAVSDNTGILLTQISEVEVEALPTDLPDKIEVDVTRLFTINEQIIVSDLKAPAGVEILTDAEQVVVKIGELVTKEAQAEAKAQAAVAEAAKAEATAAEGAQEAPSAEEGKAEKPAEGQKPDSEVAKEEKKP